MLQFPKSTHNLHQFSIKEKLYVADLDTCKVLEINKLISEILEICHSMNTEKILQTLKVRYEEEEILEALDILGEFSDAGLLFGKSLPEVSSNKMRILAPTSKEYGTDLTWKAFGAWISHPQLLSALTKYAEVYVTQERDTTEDIHFFPFQSRDTASILRVINADFDGILLWLSTDMEFLHLLSFISVPFVVSIRQQRGGGGLVINAVLRWYTSLRDFDTFVILTESEMNLYSHFLLDTSFFHIIPTGVDLDLFKPMEKKKAKKEVAKMLSRPEITEKKVVGFLSRFIPEKGAGIFIKVAEMNPEYIFLVVVPDLGIYNRFPLPENLIYAGKQPRNKLPLFYNTFDVQCFPTMWESFGRVALEAMACGTPPVVPDFDGLPYFISDGGILVSAKAFEHELGSFGSYVSPIHVSKAVNNLLKNEEKRKKMAKRARGVALKYSWDNAARKLVALFQDLKKKRQAVRRKRNFKVAFTQDIDLINQERKSKSLLLNLTETKETPLYGDYYAQTVEEGLALSLLHNHTVAEVEAVLRRFFSEEKTRTVLKKVRGFLDATS